MTSKNLSRLSAWLIAILNLQLAGLPMGILPEIMLLVSVICLCTFLYRHFGTDIKAMLLHLLCKNSRADKVLNAVFLYLVFDLAGLLYSENLSHAVFKYRVVFPVAVVFLMLSACRIEKEHTKRFFLYSSVSGIAASLAVIINTLVFPLFTVEYIKRLSLRTDYNMFATALLAAFICSVGYAIRARYPCGYYFVSSCVIVPVMVLACSRRVWLMLVPVFVASAALLISKHRLKGIMTVISCAVVSAILVMFISYQMALRYESGAPLGLSESVGSAVVSERLETVSDSSMLTKRLVIWNIAIEEFGGFNALNKIFGRGAFYDITVYDEPKLNDRLDDIYRDRTDRLGNLSAHSCVLADMLNGGFLKLASLLIMLSLIAYECLRETVLHPYTGLCKLMLFAMVLSNSLISNRYGLLYDRWFWFLLALLASEGGGLNEKTHSHADGGTSR